MDISILKPYIVSLDDANIGLVRSNVVEKGIEKYLSLQLTYLDCSRVINDMRMMQTIGYPYQREITFYLYALEHQHEILATKECNKTEVNKDEWIDKLLKLHAANVEYEKEHPPVWYGGKKAKKDWEKKYGKKLPRRRNVKQTEIKGMGKELSNVERLKRLSAQFGPLKFKLKINKT